MKNNKISILGTGWLGFPLAQSFIANGYRVKVSTTTTSKLAELTLLNAEAFVINLDSELKDIQKFLNSEILIINIPSKNVEGFKNLLAEIEKSKIKKVIFISSTSVYAEINKTIYESDEAELQEHPLIQIENLFRSSKSISTTVLRFGGLIGYTRHPAKFFAKGGVVSNPDSFVNLIHRDDCIEIINQIIIQKVWSEVFNCCADTHPTKREFYEQASKSAGLPAPMFESTNEMTFKIISNAKLKDRLNYNFVHRDLLKIYSD
jgi:nucleoside-diphosphate-sugar epimerase